MFANARRTTSRFNYEDKDHVDIFHLLVFGIGSKDNIAPSYGWLVLYKPFKISIVSYDSSVLSGTLILDGNQHPTYITAFTKTDWPINTLSPLIAPSDTAPKLWDCYLRHSINREFPLLRLNEHEKFEVFFMSIRNHNKNNNEKWMMVVSKIPRRRRRINIRTAQVHWFIR